MDEFEKPIKTALLSAFSFLNAVDMVQTLAFLRVGIEGNPFVIYYPELWFPLKFVFTFGLPLGVYRLDNYLEAKKDEGIFPYLKGLVAFAYVSIFFADLFFLSLVLRNTTIFGGLFP